MSNQLWDTLCQMCDEARDKWGVSAQEIADTLQQHRSNVSRELNRLVKHGLVEKKEGRPVLFRVARTSAGIQVFGRIIGAEGSFRAPIEQAKAALLYPPYGLHTLLFGATGVGKSMFARLMYEYRRISTQHKGEFVTFNCADYAHNPQLLLSQLFGSVKGSYTGASQDRRGLLERADGGMLFLDEIHRLPPEGQEMLFTYLDTGCYRKLGETEDGRQAQVFIVAATTEQPDSVLLKTFRRRIPMEIQLPKLADRPLNERIALIRLFCEEEARRLKKNIVLEPVAVQAFIAYECPGNVGQLKKDIQLSCAHAYAEQRTEKTLYILQSHLPLEVKRGALRLRYLLEKPELDHLIGTCQISTKDPESTEAGEEIPIHFQMPRELSDARYADRDNIRKIVEPQLIDLAHQLLSRAEEKLGKAYPPKVYAGLAMHIDAMVKRLKKGKMTSPYNLNELRKKYPQAFIVATESMTLIEKTLQFDVPMEEIGYLTLFYAYDESDNNWERGTTAVIVMAHGTSTASSMLSVAQDLLDISEGWAIDVPLSMNPEHAFEKFKDLAVKVDTGRGVLLLVDMGSLENFGALLSEETGIVTATIKRVSTPLVIEALRKANLGHTLEEIVNSIKANEDQSDVMARPPVSSKSGENARYVIMLCCLTGTGGAEQLEQLVEEHIHLSGGVLLQTVAAGEWNEIAKQLKQNRQRVVAAIGLWQGENSVPLSMSPSDILLDSKCERLQRFVNFWEQRFSLYQKMKSSLAVNMKSDQVDMLLEQFLDWLEEIEQKVGEYVTEDTFVGVAMHFVCLVDRLKQGERYEGRGDKAAEPPKTRLAKAVLRHLSELERQTRVVMPSFEKSIFVSMFNCETFSV